MRKHVEIEQFFLKLGTPTTIENVHNTADTKYSVYHAVAKIAVMSMDRRYIIQNGSTEKRNRLVFA